MGSGVPRQRRRMVTSGGCGGLQPCGGGQGGVGGLRRGASHAEERQGNRGGRGGEKGGGHRSSSVEAARENKAGSGARRGEGGSSMGRVPTGGVGGGARVAGNGWAWRRRAPVGLWVNRGGRGVPSGGPHREEREGMREPHIETWAGRGERKWAGREEQ
jgi:hypothetical protein